MYVSRREGGGANEFDDMGSPHALRTRPKVSDAWTKLLPLKHLDDPAILSSPSLCSIPPFYHGHDARQRTRQHDNLRSLSQADDTATPC
jgi:hypothetical protein